MSTQLLSRFWSPSNLLGMTQSRALRLQANEGRWPKQIKTDSAKWDKSKKCAYHKEHDHTTKQCRSFHYLVEKLLKFGHLKQYVCSDERRAQTDQDLDVQILRTSIAPRVAINYIHGGPTDEEYNSK
ncbi:hypothetical protein CK203_107434 [Vitis vinifera]|uniref:Gag-pol polyprotein n=1 Tax=Vitis vinifera TaxID=29760 RepID=A0A438FHZ2_VITVI|nr:hypothetical protein CK203_107434 [Vitis vinifera]